MKYLKYFENNVSVNFKELTTLINIKIDKHVENFECQQNMLTSLEGCPEIVDAGFYCQSNKLTSLEFCPKKVGGKFNCAHNRLTSLEFCPEFVGLDFYSQENQLTSLEFSPKKINGEFNCYRNKLTSLEFCPEYVSGDFHCWGNELITLDFYPEYVGGKFNCTYHDLINPVPYELIEKFKIDSIISTIYDPEQIVKFYSYEFQKEFLTNTPEKYKDLNSFGYAEGIKDEFDWLFNAIDMGLM